MILTSILTPEQKLECEIEAEERVKQQLNDAKNGISQATYSFGAKTQIYERSFEERVFHAKIGALAEKIASILTHSTWTKERLQYNGNLNPDLTVTYRQEIVPCEVRGTSSTNSVIYRPWRDDKKPKILLIAVTNLPNGEFIQAGHRYMGFLRKLYKMHPEWEMGKSTARPYFAIPFKYFITDFSEFGV